MILMNIPLLFRTVRHLKMTQVWHQLKNCLVKPTYKLLPFPHNNAISSKLYADPIPRSQICREGRFCFLNLTHDFEGWNYVGNGMLWAYNQNYFDFINQDGFTKQDACRWIDKFIADLPTNKIGLDPYPIALRSINWIKFFCRHPECASQPRLDSLYSQVKLLEKKLEYHLLGNHLLEDAFALFIAAVYFQDDLLYRKAWRLLKGQLTEQILPDGAHYEQSPMYHCILLDRLLDCLNISLPSPYTTAASDDLKRMAVMMLGHLESIVWEDGTIPLLNDAAYGIAPEPNEIFGYARRLGLEWTALPMTACGYRKMKAGYMEAVVDIGNMASTYQPGHSHADTFNYELRLDGKPYIVDTGISTYNKTERRQQERSTRAHNTVVVDGRDSSEVWGGFRVGRRAKVSDCQEAYGSSGGNVVEACHEGYEKWVRRRFSSMDETFVVEDWYDGDAVSHIHLAEGADERRIQIDGALTVETGHWAYSTEYNRFREGKELKIAFKGYLKYTIR